MGQWSTAQTSTTCGTQLIKETPPPRYAIAPLCARTGHTDMAAFKVVSRLSYSTDAIRFGDTQALMMKAAWIFICSSDVTSYAVTRLGFRTIGSSMRWLSLKLMVPYTRLKLIHILLCSSERCRDKTEQYVRNRSML